MPPSDSRFRSGGVANPADRRSWQPRAPQIAARIRRETGPRRLDARGRPGFRIASVEWRGAPLFVLWTIDRDSIWVLPSASRSRRDMSELGRTIQLIGSFWQPQMASKIADLKLGGRSRFVNLEDEDHDTIAAELLRRFPPAGNVS